MNPLKRFWAVFRARNIEFLRDRGALAWNIAFPFFVVFGMAFAFSGRGQEIFKVGVAGGGDLPPGFAATRHLKFASLPSVEEGLSKLRTHQVDLLVAPGRPLRYWVNDDSPKGYLAERVLLGTDAGAGAARGAVSGRPVRYVDWLVSGLLGMNMMFSALFGVGYAIVRYRRSGVLKRLKATPLAAAEFLAAQVASRLVLIMGVFAIVYHGADFFLDFRRLGSLLDLYLVFALGATCLISLGLLVACRTASEELAGGLLNMLSWPMMFLSGVWFSLEGAPRPLRLLADAFPLTHAIAAARAVMTDGAGLAQIAPQLGLLAAMTAAFLALGAFFFRWE
jgi:ABC-2 type transport system permease protein